MSEFFKSIPKIAYEGKNSKNPLAFKFYNPDEVIAGKTMREQLKFALSWWHKTCIRDSADPAETAVPISGTLSDPTGDGDPGASLRTVRLRTHDPA